MFKKVFGFLANVAMNGIIAIFLALAAYIVLAAVFLFATIPVEIIAGEAMVDRIIYYAEIVLNFRVIYAIVFILLMAKSLGFNNIKTTLRGWAKKRGYSI